MTDAPIPKLSIGLPVFNGARYIHRAIESVLGQSFGDLELIISDNGSTDDTQAICREYAARDGRVRYERQPRQHSKDDNFHYVFSQARGDYFMWLAADDWWDDGFLERAVAILDLDPRVVLVFSYFRIYDWRAETYGPRLYMVASHGSPRARLLTRLLNPIPNALYGMYRRSAVDYAEMQVIDFSDMAFLNHMAVKGDIAVISDDLFVAGWKPVPIEEVSVGGGSIRVWPYYRDVARLIRRNFRGVDRLILWLFLVRQVAGLYRTYRGRNRKT